MVRWLVRHERSLSLSRFLMGTHRRDVGRQLFGWLRSKILALTPGHWNFELANAGSKEIAKPRFESRHGVEYYSGKMESRSRNFPRFRGQRAAASSSGLKGTEVQMTLKCWDLPQVGHLPLMSLVGTRFPVLCAPFFASCEAMEFAELRHRREERPDLPVSLLMVLHALRLESE